MHRRALLKTVAGLAGAGALAGCFMERPPTELRLVPATPARLAEAFATPGDEYPDAQRRLVADLLDDGATVEAASGEPELPDGEYVTEDGRYYAVTTTYVDEVRTTGYDLVVRRPSEETPVDDPSPVETVAFDDLPATDRAAFLAADPGEMDPGLGASLFLSTDEFDPSASTFATADGPVRVAYEGTAYRVEYEGRETREDRRYRYGVEAVGTSRSAFVAHVTGRYLFPVDDGSLSADQRDVLDEAVVETPDENGYTEERGYGDDAGLSEPFRDVLDRVSAHAAPGRTYGDGGTWLCAYEGDRYLAEIEWAGEAVTDRDDYRTATDAPPTDRDTSTTAGPTPTTGAGPTTDPAPPAPNGTTGTTGTDD